jgi:DNA-binding transcriptional regulator YiaG
VPFCHLRFSASRPVERRYERAKVPAGTLGAAFRERRWSRCLEQWQAAKEIGVSTATYRNWEVNRSVPTVKHLPGAITFLGYDWRLSDGTFGDRVRNARTGRGLSIRQLAAALGVDPSTLARWEANDGMPSAALRPIIHVWLTANATSVSEGRGRKTARSNTPKDRRSIRCAS